MAPGARRRGDGGRHQLGRGECRAQQRPDRQDAGGPQNAAQLAQPAHRALRRLRRAVHRAAVRHPRAVRRRADDLHDARPLHSGAGRQVGEVWGCDIRAARRQHRRDARHESFGRRDSRDGRKFGLQQCRHPRPDQPDRGRSAGLARRGLVVQGVHVRCRAAGRTRHAGDLAQRSDRRDRRPHAGYTRVHSVCGPKGIRASFGLRLRARSAEQDGGARRVRDILRYPHGTDHAAEAV